jgi:hypothetical protein
MALLKPPTNFKFRHFFFWFLLIFLLVPNLLQQKQVICCPPSLELQDGSSKSLFTANVSFLSTIISVEKPMSLDFNPTIPKPKKAKKVEWQLKKAFQDISLQNCLGQRQ